MAAAARAAGAAFKIFFFRQTAEFESLGEIFIYGILHLVHLLLGFHEIFRDRITEELLALLLERFDFRVFKLHALLLLMLQVLTFFAEVLVHLLRFGVDHEFVHVRADGLKLGLFQNRFAKFARLLDQRFIGLCMHKGISVSASGRFLAICQQAMAGASRII